MGSAILEFAVLSIGDRYAVSVFRFRVLLSIATPELKSLTAVSYREEYPTSNINPRC
jgi:hypothetical protein